MMQVTRRSVASLAALAAAASLIAQEKPTFKSGVEVVLIDVNVLDRSHSPVGNLQPDDFLVTVDRKPRKVVSAQFIRYDAKEPPSDAAKVAAGEQGRPQASTSPSAAPPRNVLVALDTDNLQTVDGAVAKRAVGDFVERLRPDDRVGIVTIPRLNENIRLTTDRQETRKVLDTVNTSLERWRGEHNIGLAEAFQAERERADGDTIRRIIGRECCGPMEPSWPCPPTDRRCPESVRGEVKMMQLQEHERGQRFLVALQELGQSLSSTAGPKTLVLVTGGVPAAGFGSGAGYDRVAEALARGEVSLYTILIEPSAFDVSHRSLSRTAGDDAVAGREGAENATSAAGGVLMMTAGTLGGYFERVVKERWGSYLLGIEVTPADRDGRPHNVEVKVARTGLEVRARRRYVIEPAVAHTVAPVPGPDLTALAHPSNAARSVDHTPPATRSVVALAGDYVLDYVKEVVAAFAEERCRQKLSKWTARSGKGEWVLSVERTIAAEYLLVRRAESAGWSALRDVFEVDGAPVHARDGRLKRVLTGDPSTAVDRAKAISNASAIHELGFVDRAANVPTAALLFVHPADSGRFVFAKEKEEVSNGNAIWQVAFTERATPAIVQGSKGDIPAEGEMSVDPANGRIVKTLVRWDMDGTVWEIAVQYRANSESGGLWVPSEMREVYTSATTKLECDTMYSNFVKAR